MCKACNENSVYESRVNKIKYCKSCFNKYFEKKVRKTIRTNKLISKKDKLGMAVKRTSSLVAQFLIKKILRNPKLKIIRNKKFKIKDITRIITGYNLDNEAENIITSVFNKKKPKLGPRIKKEIRPLYLMTEQEIRLFAKLNKIKITKQKLSKTAKLLNKFEDKYPETKYAIVKSSLKIS